MKASIPNLTSMTSMPGIASMSSIPGLPSMHKKGLSDLLDFSLIRFGLSNPYLTAIFSVIIIVAYLFMISPYRPRTPSYLSYTTNIEDQVEEWITHLSNDLMNIYFLKNEEVHIIDAILPGSASKIKQLCDKMDFFIHTADSDISNEYNDANKTKIIEKLNIIKNIFSNLDNGENIDAFIKFKIFDFIIFIHNNFCKMDDIGAYFFYNNNYFHNLTYFVNRNYQIMEASRKVGSSPPSINKSANNNISYKESIIPFVYESYMKNVMDAVNNTTLKNDDDDDAKPTAKSETSVTGKIHVSVFEKKNKMLWQFLLSKVKDISSTNKSLIIINAQIINTFFINIKTSINIDKIMKYFEEDDTDENINYFEDVGILNGLNSELQSACSFNEEEPTSKFFYEFENMLYAFENEYGRGALIKEPSLISKIMNLLHEIVLLHHFNKNKSIIDKAISVKEKITVNHFNAFYSVQNLQISCGKQFPTLINNDSNQSINLNRDKYMINIIIQKIIISIVNTWKLMGNGLISIFSRKIFSFHLKENNDTLNMLMQYPSNFRMYLRSIQNNPGGFLLNALK